jgi:hypothetical protein
VFGLASKTDKEVLVAYLELVVQAPGADAAGVFTGMALAVEYRRPRPAGSGVELLADAYLDVALVDPSTTGAFAGGLGVESASNVGTERSTVEFLDVQDPATCLSAESVPVPLAAWRSGAGGSGGVGG